MPSGLIFEGPDGSGKSTTALYISRAVGIPLFHPVHSNDENKNKTQAMVKSNKYMGGPPQSTEEMNNRVKTMLQQDNVIFDRFPLISEQVYGPILRGKCQVDLTDWKMRIPFRVIYCRPSIETIVKVKLIKKPHKSKAMIKQIKENLVSIIIGYDRLMKEIPHIKFNRDIHNMEDLTKVLIREF